MQNEMWKDIEGWDLYQVSNMGRVRSKDRTHIRANGRPDNRKGKVLKPAVNKCGYPRVSLWDGDRRKTFTVHSLVAKAFCERHKNSECVHHKNSIKTDNRAENLEWTTNRKNIIEKWKFYSPNKTGAHLVKNKTVRPWRSVIWVAKDKQVCLGYYDTEDEACAAYNSALRLLDAIEWERSQ